MYRPPNGNKTSFINYWLELVNPLKNINKKEVYALGDVNIDVKIHDNYTKMLLDTMRLCKLIQQIDVSTRLCKTKCTLLDHIYTNSKNVISKGTGPMNISDHLLVYITRRKLKDKLKRDFVIDRRVNLELMPGFKEDIQACDWHNVYSAKNIDDIWEEIQINIHKCSDPYFPVKKKRKKLKKDEWITKDIAKLIDEKNILLVQAKKSEDSNDIAKAHKHRNYVNRIVSRAKKQYYKKLLNENLRNPKKLWETINEIVPSGKNKNEQIQLTDKENNVIENNILSDYINEFFNKVGSDKSNYLRNISGPAPCPTFQFQPTTSDEIESIVKKINTKKSSMIKNIPTSIFKTTFLLQPDILTFLINKCIIENDIPSSWKRATIKPIKKVNNSTSVNDLRPISLLPIPTKIIEKILVKQCIKHLTTHKLLDINQFGFQKNKSTISTIAEFTDDIHHATEKNQFTLTAFIDLSKAFDRLDHNILLHKLKFFGFGENCIKFFKNYLTDRTQVTLNNKIYSNTLKVTHGLPQGSNVGPLMFLLYINDISSSIHQCKFKLFADDTAIYCSDEKIENCVKKLNDDLKCIVSWCSANNMQINAKKTKIMLYGKRNMLRKVKNINLDVKVEDCILARVKTYKYLGVHLDEFLTYNKHINQVIRNANHKLYLLKRVRQYLTEKTSIMVYKSYILPLLEYGSVLYMASNKNHLARLQVIQNHALKTCLEVNKRTSTELIHKLCNINYLEDRRDIMLLKLMFLRSVEDRFLDKNMDGPTTRSKSVKKLAVPHFLSSASQKSVAYRGSNAWNNLDIKIKKIENKPLFHSTMKKILKEKRNLY